MRFLQFGCPLAEVGQVAPVGNVPLPGDKRWPVWVRIAERIGWVSLVSQQQKLLEGWHRLDPLLEGAHGGKRKGNVGQPGQPWPHGLVMTVRERISERGVEVLTGEEIR